MLFIGLKKSIFNKYCFKKIVPNEQTKADNSEKMLMYMP